MVKELVIDVETTTFQKGNPFSRRNKLCYVGMRTYDSQYILLPIEYDSNPYGNNLRQIQEIIDEHDLIVGFNLKFDLHWLSRYNINFSTKRVFDTQLCEFILSNQSNSYPSLDDTALKYDIEGKLDLVKTEYWNKGIDTPDVPRPLLEEYLAQDLKVTYEVYQKQLQLIPETQQRLISLENQDLLALLETEENGLKYDVKTSLELAKQTKKEIDETDSILVELSDFTDFNPASNDHISCVLYGGSLRLACRESYTFTYKSGQTVVKERNGTKERLFDRLIVPITGSNVKKEGFYATNAGTLTALLPRATKKAKKIIQLLLKRGKLDKLHGTYLKGIPDLIEEMDWPEGTVHGTLNQCTAITGRLSSTKPNLQNFDRNIGNLFVSRYVN